MGSHNAVSYNISFASQAPQIWACLYSVDIHQFSALHPSHWPHLFRFLPIIKMIQAYIHVSLMSHLWGREVIIPPLFAGCLPTPEIHSVVLTQYYEFATTPSPSPAGKAILHPLPPKKILNAALTYICVAVVSAYTSIFYLCLLVSFQLSELLAVNAHGPLQNGL